MKFELIVDEEKLKEFFDDKTIRVFDLADSKYKDVNITGLQARKLSEDIAKKFPIKVKE